MLVPLAIRNPSARTPFREPLGGLACVLVSPGIEFAQPGRAGGTLSLAVACDIREACTICFTDDGADGTGWTYRLDAGFASHAQRLRVPWPDGAERVRVSEVEGPGELWVVSEQPLGPVLVSGDTSPECRRREALRRLREDALCEFSWMGGCVLDGMRQWEEADPQGGWADAIERWLDHFIRESRLCYQDPRGMPVRDRFGDIESTLPVATIAWRDPWHPACAAALDAFERLRGEDGLIASGSATAEGCYTVAYPLAVLAAKRGDAALAEDAYRQLELRRERLCFQGDLYLRSRQGTRTFRNWGRGVCWYLLGMARCLGALGADRHPGLAAHFIERAAWVRDHQRPDGLWDNFFGENGYPPDSSGSAGIAAALMWGYSAGLLDETARACAERCWEGIGDCLEPDGWLGSVAPNNKRGESEQHTTRRTIEPFALGLYGQLAASLRKTCR